MCPLIFIMLPDKQEWAKEFIGSDRYWDIIEKISIFPEPDFLPLWDFRSDWVKVSRRQNIYLRRILPLQAFYIIDYIDKQTNGGNIVNLCAGSNTFAGMYNITDWLGKTSFRCEAQITLLDLDGITNLEFENSMSVCQELALGYHALEKVIKQLANMTNNYCYVSFDSVDLRKYTPEQFIVNNNLSKYYKRILFVEDIVDRLSDRFDIVYYENIMEDLDKDADNVEPFDGDIRLLLKAKPSVKV